MKISLPKIYWTGALFLCLTPPAALILTTIYLMRDGFQWQIWALGALFYTLTASSITGGYHRLFSHRAYEARSWLKWYYALFGAAAFQNSILIWARDHRVHHRFVDTDKDPYSINKGFFYAHFGWMILKEIPAVNPQPYGRDLERDPIVRFQNKYYVLIATTMCFGLPALLGYFLGSALGGLAVAGFLRVVAVHHMTFFINSWCHYFGRQTYTNDNTARDSVFMAVATFGEGYHNYHHIFAQDYRNGIRWYHWDPTKWMIQFFALVGGAHSLRRVPWSDIVRMQMQMDERRLKMRLHNSWPDSLQQQLDSLKVRVESAYLRWEQLREEYKQSATIYAQSKMERYQELKFQLRVAKIEFRAAADQWRAYTRFLTQLQPN